jgi:hypothetical protein
MGARSSGKSPSSIFAILTILVCKGMITNPKFLLPKFGLGYYLNIGRLVHVFIHATSGNDLLFSKSCNNKMLAFL